MAAVAVAAQRRRRQNRIFRQRVTLDDMRDGDILTRYRLSREAITELCDMLVPDLKKPTNRTKSIPVLTQVLVGLRFLAKGDFLSEVADLHGVSRSSACLIIQQFIAAVNARLDNIRFPAGAALTEVKQGFYRKCKIPNCIGAVDGTLIPIFAPKENEDIYICRKNFHAINVQAVVDHKARFTDVVSKWPGSTHDASIFDNSGLKVHLAANNIGHLLGDSGYGLKTYLLTPVADPSTPSEQAYNTAHSSGRMVVERAFGMLKSRFRCLHKTGGCLYMQPVRCCHLIVACARLHNLCIERNIPLPEPLVQEEPDLPGFNIAAQGAVGYRQSIIRLFENL